MIIIDFYFNNKFYNKFLSSERVSDMSNFNLQYKLYVKYSVLLLYSVQIRIKWLQRGYNMM